MLVPLSLAWLLVWRESRQSKWLGFNHLGEPRIRSPLNSAGVIDAAIVVSPFVAVNMLLCTAVRYAR